MDGLARRRDEAPILVSAMQFYKRPKLTVVHVKVGNDWATARLLARGRSDDTEKDIRERLEWFDTDVKPVLEYFGSKPESVEFVEVNGEQTIERVHQDILKKLF